MAAYTAPGWYGKLPSTGDFVHHRLSEQQISPWNHWFQQGLMHWHQQAWSFSANFLHAPVWNFVLPVTATRPQIQMGCLLPSCDRVGRDWPLLALHSFPLRQWHPAQLTISGDWFQDLGATLLRAVQNPLNGEQLEQQIQSSPYARDNALMMRKLAENLKIADQAGGMLAVAPRHPAPQSNSHSE